MQPRKRRKPTCSTLSSTPTARPRTYRRSRTRCSYPHGTALTCYYHDAYKRIVTNYTPRVGSRKDSYYRVDYYTNETFKQGLDDGHTLEVVLRSNRNDGTKEYKPFSAHEAGGTGFLICKEGQRPSACITFLPM